MMEEGRMSLAPQNCVSQDVPGIPDDSPPDRFPEPVLQQSAAGASVFACKLPKMQQQPGLRKAMETRSMTAMRNMKTYTIPGSYRVKMIRWNMQAPDS